MKIYSKYLVAPLSLLMVLACSPNQYQNKGEYDDIYFTKNDRNTQPKIVAEAQQPTSQLNQPNSSQATVPVELQEKYTNSDEVVYYEEQGPRVEQPSDLNYQDFLYDYENEYLAYYDLPLDWSSDWNEASFNSLMATDIPFRLAWYDQYYMGDDYRMRQYLGGAGNLGSNRRNFYGPTIGVGMNFIAYGPGLYPGGMLAVDLNPWGFNDIFWRPRWSIYDPWTNFYSGISFTGFIGTSPSYGRFGWCPNPIYYSYGTFRTIDLYPVETNRVDPRLVRAGRLGGTSVSTISGDSQNGSQIRTRSQRIVSTNGAPGSRTVTTTQRTNGGRITGGRGAIQGTNANITRASVAAANNTGRRVNTDAYRFNNSSSRSRITRSRVTASQVSSGRSVASSTRGSRTSVSRGSVSSTSVNRTSRSRTSTNNLSFSRGSSSSFSRAATSRNSYSRGAASSSFGTSRNSGFSRSNNPGSTSRGNSRSSFSRNSSSSSGSRGSVSRSSSSSSRSSSSSSSVSKSSSRSGRN